MQAIPPSPGSPPPPPPGAASDSAASTSWNDPANVRARVLRLEQQRLARPDVKPILPAPRPAHALRRRVVRPLFLVFYVMLLGMVLVTVLFALVMLFTDSPYCVTTGYRETCGTFGEVLAEITLIPAPTWRVLLAGLVIYYLSTVSGLWLMRGWGWWLAVAGLFGNFALTMLDMGMRVFLIWTISAVCLLWFVRNRWRFRPGTDR